MRRLLRISANPVWSMAPLIRNPVELREVLGLRTSGETLKLSPTALSASISFLPVWLCCRNVIIPFIIFISSLCCYLPQKHVWAQAQFGVIDGSRKSVLCSGLLYDSDWGPHCKFLIGPLDKKDRWWVGMGGGGWGNSQSPGCWRKEACRNVEVVRGI